MNVGKGGQCGKWNGEGVGRGGGGEGREGEGGVENRQ